MLVWVSRLVWLAAVAGLAVLALDPTPAGTDAIRDAAASRVSFAGEMDAMFGPDKVTHFLAFAFLSFLAFPARLKIFERYAPVAILIFLFGVLIEYLQARGGVRHAEISDILANGAGVFAGTMLAIVFDSVFSLGARMREKVEPLAEAG